MIRPTKKAKSLLQRLADAPRKQNGPKKWIDLLPKKVADEIIEIKTKMKSGEIKCNGKYAADQILEEYGNDTLNASANTIRQWLYE